MGDVITHRQITDVAARLFGELGYDGTSLHMIAEAVGTDASTLSEVAGDKRRLYLDVMRQAYEVEQDMLESLAARGVRGRTAVHEMVDGYLDFYLEYRENRTLWVQRWLSDAADITELEDRYLCPMLRVAVDMIADSDRPGVDPYYVAEVGARHGIMSNLILAARMRNEGMPKWVADQITLAMRQMLGRRSIDASILVLGVTFKEDVPDIRNSKVVPMIRKLETSGFRVVVHDPVADPHAIAEEYGLTLTRELPDADSHLGVIGAVRHRDYLGFDEARLRRLMQPGGIIFDLKRIWPQLTPAVTPDLWVL